MQTSKCLLLSVRRPSTVAPLAHGGELKNRKVPALNMTNIGKCRHKKSPGKNTDFRSFQILGRWIWCPTLYNYIGYKTWNEI
jgi:hypothetical protein